MKGFGFCHPIAALVVITCSLTYEACVRGEEESILEGPPPFIGNLSVAKVSGDYQVEYIFSALADSLRVLVMSDSIRANNVTVIWAVPETFGTVSPDTTITDSRGIAATLWTLGAAVGAQTASASVEGASGSPLRFSATALNRVYTVSVPSNGGDGQTGHLGSTLPNPLRVLVKTGDVPASGIRVDWQIDFGGGSVFPATVTSDSAGIASTSWTLGANMGLQRAYAFVGSAPPGFQVVRFTATAVDTTGLIQMTPTNSGDGQADTIEATLSNPLRVLVTRNGNLAPSVVVRWEGSGTISAEYVLTDEFGIASVTWTLPGFVGEVYMTAQLGSGYSAVDFKATVSHGKPILSAYNSNTMGKVNSEIEWFAGTHDRLWNVVSGVTIEWNVTEGGGSITPLQGMSGENGIASAIQTLGPVEGTNSATATALNVQDFAQASFTAAAVTEVVGVDDSNNSFVPDSVGVPLGKTVGWIWIPYEYGEHDVTFEDNTAQPPSSGRQTSGTHTRVFAVPGTYRYRCTLHSPSFRSGQVGIVVVQ